MDIRELTATLSVAPQITPADVAQIANAGFKTIISNRPDGEEATQPPSAEIEAAARIAGLDFIAQPVVSGAISDADVDAFTKILGGARGPVLAFCRTGTRCTMLWALSEARTQSPDSLVATAKQAGYDLTALKPRLRERHQAGADSSGASSMRTFDIVIVGGDAASRT